MFNKATDWGMFDLANPALRITQFKEISRERFLQPDELKSFFESVAAEKNETIRDYILISLLTGARRSNVLSMQWDEISFERAEWRIPETKNGTSHTLPITEQAMQILKQRKESQDSNFIFPGTGKSGHLVEPKKGWTRIKERAGIKDLRLHDLRRSLGSWQATTGASLPIIGKTLAHKNVNTTAIYARLNNDPVRESMEKATSAMMNAGKQGAEIISIKKNG
jgi:integrase